VKVTLAPNAKKKYAEQVQMDTPQHFYSLLECMHEYDLV
jgi:hypothetical protein